MPMSPHRLALAGILLAIAFLLALPGSATATTPAHGVIAETALRYEGTWQPGECWGFMKKVVLEATGKSVGFDYREGYFEAGAIEVSRANAESGDIIQIALDANTSPDADYPGMHTAIILDVMGNGTFRVIDSNSQYDSIVRVRDGYDPAAIASSRGLQYHIYRITGSAPPSETRLPSARGATTKWTAGDHASVNTPGDCLNMRSGAGLSFASTRCLPHHTAVTILDLPVTMAGRSWVHISSPQGDGWVATEFLSTAEPVPGSAAGPTKPLMPYRSVAVFVSAN